MPCVITQVDTVASQAGMLGPTLRELCMSHFVEFLGQRDLNFSYGACLAAVAVEPTPALGIYVSRASRSPFSLIYGASGLFKGLDPQYNRINAINTLPARAYSNSGLEEHAEQTAILTAESLGYDFHTVDGWCHIYVDYPPCGRCGPWLQARPESWMVHTWATALDSSEQRRVGRAKKAWRSETFGRQFEPARAQR